MKKKSSVWIICFICISSLAAALPAYDIAKNDLQKNYVDHGITAGQSHFSDVWARDAFYATLGANRLGDYEQTKITLQTFIDYEREDGLIPLRVGDKYIALKFLGLHTKKVYPKYEQDKGDTYAVDPNCLFIIATWDYIEHYGDWSFATTNYEKIKQIITWLNQQDTDNNNLIEEENYGNWADALKTKGEVLYSNVCYYKAMRDMAKITEVVANTQALKTKKTAIQKEANKYNLQAQEIKKAINEQLYNGEYYDQGFDKQKNKRTWFSTDGNALAIIWGVANQTQAKSIIDYAESTDLTEHFSAKLNTPILQKELVSTFIKFVGLKEYHTGEILWPWVGEVYCVAKEKAYEGQGQVCLNKIGKKYEQYQTVYEVYEQDETPVDRLLYNAEHQFAWGAGLYIYAQNEIKNGKSTSLS